MPTSDDDRPARLNPAADERADDERTGGRGLWLVDRLDSRNTAETGETADRARLPHRGELRLAYEMPRFTHWQRVKARES